MEITFTQLKHKVFSLFFLLLAFKGYGQCSANFTVPAINCLHSNVAFTYNGSAGTYSYQWNFGDPFSGAANTDTLKNPSHQFNYDGVFKITLVISNNSGCSDTIRKNIRILKKLTANYTVSQTCIGMATQFTSAIQMDTFDKPNTYSWQFGDGGTSTGANPSHTYASIGSKTITYAINTKYGCKDTLVNSITLFDAVTATISKDSGCINDLISFKMNGGSSTISSYKWDFGDASTSFSQNTSHQYGNSGIFPASATFTYSTGTTCTVKTKIIRINPNPDASFKILDSIQCFNRNSVCLKLKKFGPSLSYSAISFDDGFVDNLSGLTDSIVCHTYTDNLGGRYTLSINIIDKNKCAASFTSPYHVIIYPEIDAKAQLIAVTGCFKTPLKATNISNQSPPQVTKFLWDFGDSTYDNVNWAAVSHTYTKDGVFDLKLIITNTDGCTDTFISKKAAKNTSFPIDAKIDSVISICRSTNLFSFKQSPVLGGDVYWDFGNLDTSFFFKTKYHYKKVGVYHPKFFITKNNCGTTILLDSIIVYGPQAAIGNIVNQYQCSIKDTVILNNTSKYYKNKALKFSWDVGDGYAPNCVSNSKTGANMNNNCRYSVDSTGIRHMYTPGNEGCYTPRLIITDTSIGCTDTAYAPLPLTRPNAQTGLKVFSKALCLGPEKYKRVSLDFSKTKPGCGQQSYWVIWDSAYAATTSNFDSNWRYMDTFHSYNYQLKDPNNAVTIGIIIQNGTDSNNNQCRDTAWYPNIVRFAKIDPTFTTNYDPTKHYCKNANFTFTIKDTLQEDSLVSIRWFWGDNTSVQVKTTNPINHVFRNAGVYRVVLALQHKSGCIASDTTYVQVGYFNAFSPTLNQVCLGADVTLYKYVNYWGDLKNYWHDTARVKKGLESFKWDLGDGNGFSNTDQLPVITYSKIGNFRMRFATVDSAGCKDTFDNPNLFKVFKLKADFTTIRDTFKCSQQIAFTSNITSFDSSGNAAPVATIKSYKWVFGKGISNSVLANPSKFLKVGSHNVKLIVENDNCKDSITKTVTITGPQAYYEFNGDSTGCQPLKITFKNKSKLASEYTWRFGTPQKNTFFTTSDTSVWFSYQTHGDYYPTLTATAYMTSNGFPITCSTTFPDTPTITTLRRVTVYEKPKSFFVWRTDCNTYTTTFTNTSFVNTGYIARYIWDFGDGDTSHQINPVHQYADSGTYLITMQTFTDHGCTGQIQTSIRVAKNPIVNFKKKDICLGSAIQFTDSTQTFSDPIYKWTWDFKDSSISNQVNPLKLYKRDSVYNVKLTVNTITGCVNSITKQVWVHSRPKTNFTFTNKCLSQAIPLTNTTKSKETPVKYLWTLGNGDTSTKTSLNKLYFTAGNYTVKLLATTPFGCEDSITKTVITYPNPNANFNINYHQNCKIGNQFKFTNTSTTDTGSLFYDWRFGNADSSLIKNPVYTYPSSGKYIVKMVVKTHYNCKDTAIDTLTVSPHPASNKTIVPSTTQCMNTNLFKLTDITTIASGTYQRKWLLGDGTSATDSILTYKYKDTGNYTAKLTTLSNFNCPDTITFKIRINPKPIATFTIDNPAQCITGNLFGFTNTSKGYYSATTSRWYFGDGDSSLNLNSTHTYKTQNTYTVKLIATNSNACRDTITKTIVAYPRPAAQFTVKDTLPCEVNNLILFKNASTLAYGTMTYAWDFGDTKKTTGLNASHNYDTFGTYSVQLIATSNQGCKDTIKKNTTVFPMPLPAFIVNKQSQCLNSQSFVFTNKSTIGKDSFSSRWMLGEKDSAITSNITKQYKTSGIFKVTLHLKSNKGCRDSVSMKVKVFPKPFPQFVVNDSTQCVNGQAYTFTNQSNISSGSMTYNWNLGNGFKTPNAPVNYRYSSYGIYKVTLIALSDSGCVDSIKHNNEVYPKPSSNISANDSGQCVNANLFLFKGHYSIPYGSVNTYYWNLDGTYKKASIDTFKRYIDSGVHTLSFIAESINQCRDTSALKIYIQPKPIAKFLIDDSAQCLNGNKFTFTNQSQFKFSALTYAWLFGDGSQSTQISPQKTYSKNDSLTVRLIATTAVNCNDTIYSKVIIYPQPKPGFKILDSSQCLRGNKFMVQNTSKISSGAMTYVWTTDKGYKNTNFDTGYVYQKEGPYTIQLLATSLLGCVDSIKKTLSVAPQPKADFNINNAKQCLNNQAFQFTNNSAINYGIFTSEWQFGDGGKSTKTNVNHQYATHGLRAVQLKIISDQLCTDSISKNIRVWAKPDMNIAINDTDQCVNNQNLKFTSAATIKEGSIVKRKWNFGDGVIDSGINVSHYFLYTKLYIVTHIAQSDSGCIDSSKKVIRIFPKPVAKFNVNDSAQCLNTNNYFFTDTSYDASGIKNYNWNINKTRYVITQNVNHSFSDTGYKIIELTITSNNGCKDTVDRKVYVKHMPDAAFTRLAEYYCLNGPFVQLIPVETGGIFTGKNMKNDIYTPLKLWHDTVQYKISKNGCTDSVYYTTDVLPPPSVNLGKDTILCKFEFMTLNAHSWKSTYLWNNTFMTDSSQKITSAGTYIVKVTSVCGVASDTIIIAFRDNNCRFFIPNAFTPNKDDNNEYFKPITVNVPELTLRIFNRWGEKLYEGDQNSPGWDGTYEGQPVPQDVYLWQVYYRYPSGSGYIKQYEKGTLNLLR